MESVLCGELPVRVDRPQPPSMTLANTRYVLFSSIWKLSPCPACHRFLVFGVDSPLFPQGVRAEQISGVQRSGFRIWFVYPHFRTGVVVRTFERPLLRVLLVDPSSRDERPRDGWGVTFLPSFIAKRC